jgi:hypothetical protein
MNRFALVEERPFTTANSLIDRAQIFKTPPCRAAQVLKWIAHKIAKDPPQFLGGESEPQ